MCANNHLCALLASIDFAQTPASLRKSREHGASADGLPLEERASPDPLRFSRWREEHTYRNFIVAPTYALGQKPTLCLTQNDLRRRSPVVS
jgi:hypothetical protein